MCLTCGCGEPNDDHGDPACGEPNDDHGDPAHITYDDLKKAADAAEISVEEAAKNLQQTLSKV